MNDFHELLCPVCEGPLTAEGLNRRLVCPHCRVNLKQQRFINFIEYLISQDIVEDLDFFDETLYGGDFKKYENDEFDDQEEIMNNNERVKPGAFFDKNVMQVEEEYVNDIHDEDNDEDYSIFDPGAVIDADVDGNFDEKNEE